MGGDVLKISAEFQQHLLNFSTFYANLFFKKEKIILISSGTNQKDNAQKTPILYIIDL